MKKSELEVRNLEVNFYKEPNILNGVSFLCQENMVILADEDSGKSLLLKTIAGLVKYKKGSVKLDGENIKLKDLNVSLILDYPVLFENKTVLQNLKYMQNVARKSIKIVNFEQILNNFEIFDIKNVKIKKLNLFQKKVVCLARACIKKPKLLLVDEILVGLEKLEQDKILYLIYQYFAESLIIFTTKNLNFYNNLNLKTMYLKFGKILDIEQCDDLFLAKIKGVVFNCKLQSNCLLIQKNDEEKSIELSSNSVSKITIEALNVENLACSETGNVLKIYDKLTGELLENIKIK